MPLCIDKLVGQSLHAYANDASAGSRPDVTSENIATNLTIQLRPRVLVQRLSAGGRPV